VTKEGIWVRVWSWPGNTSDTSVLPEVRDGMRDWKLGRVVTVAGRGFSSNANPACLRKGGGQPVAGERMRDKAGDAAEALSRQCCSSIRRAGSILELTVIVVSFFESVVRDHSKDHPMAFAYVSATRSPGSINHSAGRNSH
jgi:hypothetical protein